MFARSRERPRRMCWEDLEHKMAQVEGEGLFERLQCYRGVLQTQFDIVTGRQPTDLGGFRRRLSNLAAAQSSTSGYGGLSGTAPLIFCTALGRLLTSCQDKARHVHRLHDRESPDTIHPSPRWQTQETGTTSGHRPLRRTRRLCLQPSLQARLQHCRPVRLLTRTKTQHQVGRLIGLSVCTTAATP